MRLPLTALLLALPLSALRSQGAAERTLSPATARLEFEFTRIVGLRELRDGRVLVADAGEKVVVVVDFAASTVVQIGRVGRGPGEYAGVSQLFSLSSDSTLMSDPATGSWLVLNNDRIVRTIPPDDPGISAVRRAGTLRGVDHSGRISAGTPPPLRAGTQTFAKDDSTALLLIALPSQKGDTITRLRMAPITLMTEFDKTGKPTRIGLRQTPLSVGEESIHFPDGWLAIARLDPYRIEWRTPEGRWIRGKPLPFVARPIDGRERQAYLDRQAQASGTPAPPPPEETWPKVLPPFQPRPLLALPDGSVLILRTPTADRPGNRYDRVDRLGRLVASLELPAAERLAGIGSQGAYVVVTDDNGIQRLRRHPWP